MADKGGKVFGGSDTKMWGEGESDGLLGGI